MMTSKRSIECHTEQKRMRLSKSASVPFSRPIDTADPSRGEAVLNDGARALTTIESLSCQQFASRVDSALLSLRQLPQRGLARSPSSFPLSDHILLILFSDAPGCSFSS
jgi:hypothetical protein